MGSSDPWVGGEEVVPSCVVHRPCLSWPVPVELPEPENPYVGPWRKDEWFISGDHWSGPELPDLSPQRVKLQN